MPTFPENALGYDRTSATAAHRRAPIASSTSAWARSTIVVDGRGAREHRGRRVADFVARRHVRQVDSGEHVRGAVLRRREPLRAGRSRCGRCASARPRCAAIGSMLKVAATMRPRRADDARAEPLLVAAARPGAATSGPRRCQARRAPSGCSRSGRSPTSGSPGARCSGRRGGCCASPRRG